MLDGCKIHPPSIHIYEARVALECEDRYRTDEELRSALTNGKHLQGKVQSHHGSTSDRFEGRVGDQERSGRGASAIKITQRREIR